MQFRTVDCVCGCGAERADVLVSVVEGAAEEVFCEECGRAMGQVIGGPRAIFANGFFSHTFPRRIETSYTDADGKVHRKDITHSVNTSVAGGSY